jgi:CubicO group peptidase (beta-lactamase class C family)
MADRGEIPSMAVGVARNGKVIWEEAFGWADRENNVAAAAHTIYDLGSLSKSVMATGMMTLIEQGRVKLDDPVNALIAPASLTAYEGSAADVRVGHVLNMTAGIPHGWLSLNDPADVPATDPQLDDYARTVPIVVFRPGEVFEYSNFSMGLAELIIRRVTKRPAADYMRTELFQPLGMKRTFVQLTAEVDPPVAAGYSAAGKRLTARGHRYPPGGLGFSSTVHDLLRYGMFHLKTPVSGQRRILSARTLDLMHTYDKGPQGRYFTLGWFAHGRRLISNGSVGGANSHLTLIPSEATAIVVLTNMSSPSSVADQIAADIVAAVSPETRAAEQGGRQRHIQRFATPYKRTAELEGEWQGTIRSHGGDLPVTLSFGDGGEVHIQLAGQDPVTLTDVRFNAFQELRADFRGKIRTLFSGPQAVASDMSITAKLKDGRLYGYVSAVFTTPKGSFSVPSYVSFRRKQLSGS